MLDYLTVPNLSMSRTRIVISHIQKFLVFLQRNKIERWSCGVRVWIIRNGLCVQIRSRFPGGEWTNIKKIIRNRARLQMYKHTPIECKKCPLEQKHLFSLALVVNIFSKIDFLKKTRKMTFLILWSQIFYFLT